MKKLVVIGALFGACLFMAQDASAWVRHRRGVVVRRVWVGRRIVVGRPVVVAPVLIGGVAHGTIDFDVEPDDTKVYVDGELRGQVDDFDGVPGKLHLLPGSHQVRLETSQGDAWNQRIRITPGHEINIKLEMEK